MPLNSRSFQHTARSRDIGLPGSRWNFPLALLLLRFHRLLLLQSVFFALEMTFMCCCFSLLLCLDFFPSYLFTALSSFSWVCWIAPNNVKVNQLFGVTHGLSMGLLTFDWGQIAFTISPFVLPWWAAAHMGAAIVFFYWILVPILYVSRHCFSLSRFSPPFLKVGFRSTPTFGTALTFPWCPQSLSITEGSNITSLKSLIPTPPSTSRLTKPTAPSSFPYHLPSSTASHSQPSPPPFHILSSTTANIYGLMLVVRSPNNQTSTHD